MSRTGKRTGPAMVTPFARALALMGAFHPGERWLCTRELGARTGLPDTTVKRMASSLVTLRYLHHDPVGHRYRLAAPVLALGYGAVVQPDVQRVARGCMQDFADLNKVEVQLGTRDRLDLVVLEACSGAGLSRPLRPQVGERLNLASSAMGWALLATVPELERFYLLDNMERRMPREWPQLRRRCMEGIAQVRERGFCSSFGDGTGALVVAAVPVVIDDHAPSVLACIGFGHQMTRAHVERELAPRLLAKASEIRCAVPLEPV